MSCTGSEDDGGGDRAALVDRGLLAPRIPRPPSGTSYHFPSILRSTFYHIPIILRSTSHHSPITSLSNGITYPYQVRLSLSWGIANLSRPPNK